MIDRGGNRARAAVFGVGLTAVLIAAGCAHRPAPSGQTSSEGVPSSAPAPTPPSPAAAPSPVSAPAPHIATDAGLRSAPAPAPAPKQSETIESYMIEHFVVTTYARDAVITGHLERMRAALMGL